jgi:hypothetical protein
MRASTEEGLAFGIYKYYRFMIIVCGLEEFTLVNTTLYTQKWLKVEKVKSLKIPFSEYSIWFEMKLVGNN